MRISAFVVVRVNFCIRFNAVRRVLISRGKEKLKIHGSRLELGLALNWFSNFLLEIRRFGRLVSAIFILTRVR